MRLKWLRRARADLFSIHDYIAKHNPDAADRVAAEILRAALQLKVFPHLDRPAQRSDLRLRQVPGLPYLLPYWVKGELIEIIAVFDERRERPEEWR
jgi:plasmid stabilization system protein ParE